MILNVEGVNKNYSQCPRCFNKTMYCFRRLIIRSMIDNTKQSINLIANIILDYNNSRYYPLVKYGAVAFTNRKLCRSGSRVSKSRDKGVVTPVLSGSSDSFSRNNDVSATSGTRGQPPESSARGAQDSIAADPGEPHHARAVTSTGRWFPTLMTYLRQ